MLRIVGDVHGLYAAYHEIAAGSEYSLQIGDMGFNYEPLSSLDPMKHMFIGGNHDNYDDYYAAKHSVVSTGGSKDYGLASLGGIDFFFVRGGFSIDKQLRLRAMRKGAPKSYWIEEELMEEVFEDALKAYKEAKPNVVITHECPKMLTSLVGDDRILVNFGFDPSTFVTMTSKYLQLMFEAHEPSEWYFGHYHRPWYHTVSNTKFICIDELGFVDLNTKENMR